LPPSTPLALDEAKGEIKWLRPEYQLPKLGSKAPQPAMDVATAKIIAIPDTAKPAWPTDPMDQIRESCAAPWQARTSRSPPQSYRPASRAVAAARTA
jgi:hypothetical protein